MSISSPNDAPLSPSGEATAGSASSAQTFHDANEDEQWLHVTSTTWARDSHELFDYEAQHVHRRIYLLRQPARILRSALDVVLAAENQSQYPAADFLVSVRKREGRFTVVPAERSTSPAVVNLIPKKLWLIVRDLIGGTHTLVEGDVVKLGRFKLRVRQLVKSAHSTLQPELRLDDAETPVTDVSAEDARSKQCRICLLDGGTVADPLICPCNCRGSIKFVHIDCLRHWIHGRLALADYSVPVGGREDQRQQMNQGWMPVPPQTDNTDNDIDGDVTHRDGSPLPATDVYQPNVGVATGGDVDGPPSLPDSESNAIQQEASGNIQRSFSQSTKVSFFFRQLYCELCKAPLPTTIFRNGERVNIVKFPRVDPPFIVLENVAGQSANRGLHVLSMHEKKELKLGRGHESDVRIADVSISRYHATIRFLDGEFILTDHNSKFGTLVALRRGTLIDYGQPLTVQAGRTVLNFEVQPRPMVPTGEDYIELKTPENSGTGVADAQEPGNTARAFESSTAAAGNSADGAGAISLDGVSFGR